MPKRMNKIPIIAINQNAPPLRNSHAACLKFQNEPHQTPEYQATMMAPRRRINPNNNSAHLFIILREEFSI